MYTYSVTNQFKKDVKRCIKRGLPMEKLTIAVRLLVESGSLPIQYKPHKLNGYPGGDTWECHLQPDWLLVWHQNNEELTLIMTNTGTHSDLF